MKPKSLLILSAASFLLTACQPSVPAKLWETTIKPEMQAHKAWLVALETFSDYNVKKHAHYFDQKPRQHTIEALNYIISYVSDSLPSYRYVSELHMIMVEKDAAGELFIDNPDDAEDQLGGQLANALMGDLFGPVYENYTKKYIISIAEYLQNQYDKIEITLDSPEFEKKSKDRITYSVYCPTRNEHYTLSIDRKTSHYYWDLEPRQNP